MERSDPKLGVLADLEREGGEGSLRGTHAVKRLAAGEGVYVVEHGVDAVSLAPDAKELARACVHEATCAMRCSSEEDEGGQGGWQVREPRVAEEPRIPRLGPRADERGEGRTEEREQGRPHHGRLHGLVGARDDLGLEPFEILQAFQDVADVPIEVASVDEIAGAAVPTHAHDAGIREPCATEATTRRPSLERRERPGRSTRAACAGEGAEDPAERDAEPHDE